MTAGASEATANTQQPWIIYLTHRVPYPPDKGDRIRTYNILRYLSRRANVLLGCLADEPVTAEELGVLKSLCAEVHVVDNSGLRRWMSGAVSFGRGRTISEGLFFERDLWRKVRRWLNDRPVTACLVSASSMAPYLRTPLAQQVETVVDLIDVDSQKWLDYAGVLGGWKRQVYRWEGRRLRRLEQSLASECNALTLVSEAEYRLFRSFCSGGQVLAVGNGVDLEFFTPQTADEAPESCVFVGAMNYPPNVDAVVWFANEVWPSVLNARPAARFTIVGRQPSERVQALASVPGIAVTGSVADVRTYVAPSQVVVAPLRIARGIQNKVLEALAMAKPVLASPAAMEGLAVTGDRELVVAEAPQEWADRLLALWTDPSRRVELGRRGRAFVETHHSWERCLEEFGRLLQLPPLAD
jgi:sugar transferase (PEP-CTERM/EpsH1 system associated)